MSTGRITSVTTIWANLPIHFSFSQCNFSQCTPFSSDGKNLLDQDWKSLKQFGLAKHLCTFRHSQCQKVQCLTFCPWGAKVECFPRVVLMMTTVFSPSCTTTTSRIVPFFNCAISSDAPNSSTTCSPRGSGATQYRKIKGFPGDPKINFLHTISKTNIRYTLLLHTIEIVFSYLGRYSSSPRAKSDRWISEQNARPRTLYTNRRKSAKILPRVEFFHYITVPHFSSIPQSIWRSEIQGEGSSETRRRSWEN